MVQKVALYVVRQVHVKVTTATDYWYGETRADDDPVNIRAVYCNGRAAPDGR